MFCQLRSGAGLRFLERDKGNGGYVLMLWPSRLYALPVALFTILWLRFLWRWYALLLLGAQLAPAHESRAFFVLFGLPFLLAGLSLIGTSIRLCFGRTALVLDGLRLQVEESVGARGAPWTRPWSLPTSAIRDFIAESSAGNDEEDHVLDAWHVSAQLEASRVILPLPVRTLAEADEVAARLRRALDHVRTPRGYRDGASSSNSDGSDTPLGASIT